eukprot:747979-Hanusia_phi.AAC.5
MAPREKAREELAKLKKTMNEDQSRTVEHLRVEFEQKVAERSNGRWDPRIADEELIGLNKKLKEQFGKDLSSVATNEDAKGNKDDFLWNMFLWSLTVGVLSYLVSDWMYVSGPEAAPASPGSGKRWGRQVQPTVLHHDMSLQDCFKGRVSNLTYHRTEVCSACHGSGAKHSRRCPHCNGRGAHVVQTPFGLAEMECPECDGAGFVVTEHCSVCHGHGKVSRKHTVQVKILPGMMEGEKISFYGEGNQMPKADPGDLVVVLKEKKDKQFWRQKYDLHANVSLTLKEALLGFSKKVDHLDGSSVVVSKKEITQMDEIMRFPGYGFMKGKSKKADRGDLFVHLAVKIPEKLSRKQVEKLEKVFED